MLCPQDRSLQHLSKVTWMCSQGEGKHLCSRAPRKSCCRSCQGTKLLWFQFSRWTSRWISPADKLGAGRPRLELPRGTFPENMVAIQPGKGILGGPAFQDTVLDFCTRAVTIPATFHTLEAAPVDNSTALPKKCC